MGTRLRHPQVVLEVTRETSAPEVLLYGRHVSSSFTGNEWIKDPFIPLSVLDGHLDALEVAETAVKGKGMGLASARNDKLAVVFTDLEALRANVQMVCDANLAQAAVIVAQCAMTLKKYTRPDKPHLAASWIAPGTVELVARSVRRGASYEWAFSADGGSTWISAGTTSGIADTTISGLTEGTEYLFRFRPTVGRVTRNWSDPITFRL